VFFGGAAVELLEPLLLVCAVLSLVLPYVLAGDRTLTSFAAYVALTVATLAIAYTHLRRWARVG
jgi:hypothetical protein